VLGICSEACEKLTSDNHELFDFLVTKKRCPDCGGSDIFGPETWREDSMYSSVQCVTCFSRFEFNIYHGDEETNACRWQSKGTLKLYDINTSCESMTFQKFIDELFIPRLIIGESYGE
jgi:hypothetical protein